MEFLKKFAFLTQLDLFGNPLAEEPDYRLKIIYHMPQIKILDRHPVTVQERIKAANKLDPAQEKHSKLLKSMTKTQKNTKVSQTLSAGEKDLYKEIREIRAREERAKEEEEEKRRTVPLA